MEKNPHPAADTALRAFILFGIIDPSSMKTTAIHRIFSII
jgi:hypothetical protein